MTWPCEVNGAYFYFLSRLRTLSRGRLRLRDLLRDRLGLRDLLREYLLLSRLLLRDLPRLLLLDRL